MSSMLDRLKKAPRGVIKPAVVDQRYAYPIRANLRSAIFDNIQTRPRLMAPYRLSDDGGIPTFREPLERSVKPLPTLPPIVGNTTYDPTMFTNPYETPGTTFLRNKFGFKRSVLPEMSSGTGEPSKTNPTIL